MAALQKLFLPGLVRAVTPLVHGEPPEEGAKPTNRIPLRRIPYMLATGAVASVPVVSGNAIRGQTRRVFIDRTLAVLDAYNLLDKHVAYFLLAGGATDQGTVAIGGAEFRKELRENLPFVDLLGGTLHGCFLAGRLRVGFMVPVTRETYWCDPIAREYGRFDLDRLPSLLDLNDAASNKPLRLARYDEGLFTEEETTLTTEEENSPKEAVRARKRYSSRMIYVGEAFPVNTVFTHYFALEWAPPATVAAFWAFVDCFLERGEVGGWLAKGCGRIETRYFDAATGGSTVNAKKKAAEYWQYLQEHKRQIRAYLEQLGTRLNTMVREARQKREQPRRGGKAG